ncbi:unnamed protein product, partial [Allacma fusca]
AEETNEQPELNTEAVNMKNWLYNHASPPQKVFEYMFKTFAVRRKELLKCKLAGDYTKFLIEWPRLLDTPGVIENDFSQSYPLVSDNLSSKWESVAIKVCMYFASIKKSLSSFGITGYSEDKCATAAFFMLAVILRTRIRKMTQMDSLKSFVQVINTFEDVDSFAAGFPDTAIL